MADESVDYEGRCPSCGHKLHQATKFMGGGENQPAPGDFNVCGYCGEILAFDASLKLVAAKLDDADEETREFLLKTQRAIRQFHGQRN